jgi:nondiscriminating glutamyl-tRNA synthetase
MRVRFAPSPTGFLHIGNARTAIINYCISRKENAPFVLRIEDTDQDRSSLESEESIYADLKWLGLDWDEGPSAGGDKGPYRQSERYDLYQNYAQNLINSGHAYKCYCTKDELDELRAKDGSFSYPGTCRDLTVEEQNAKEAEGRSHVIRFRVPENEQIIIHDQIKGDIEFSSENIGGDFIVIRTDGSPIYNFIVTIDDYLMGITDVIRGEDHLSNTPKQIVVASSVGFREPVYAHLPLVLGSDKSKLSKRHGMTSVELYRSGGYLPEALFIYIAMLGWATESGEEILSQEEIIKEISIEKMAKSSAVFDFQKLKWVNSHYIRQYSLDVITNLFMPYIEEAGYKSDTIDRSNLKGIIDLIRGNCEVLPDIKNLIPIFLDDICIPDEDADKMLKEDYSADVIKTAHEVIQKNPSMDDLLSEIKNSANQKGKKLFMPLRAMITGRLKGPELDKALPLIGYENIKKRIQHCYKTYC